MATYNAGMIEIAGKKGLDALFDRSRLDIFDDLIMEWICS